MPALQAFGRKWRIGSDDFVFPYSLSVSVRLTWFIFIALILVNYEKSYECKDERLLRIYLGILTGLQAGMVIVEVATIIISCRGTIANPEPRKKLPIMLYIQLCIFVIEFIWDIVGVLWAFDPSIDCHKSHQVLIFTQAVLVWNFIISIAVGSYLFITIGVCRIITSCCNPEKKMCYEDYFPVSTYDGYDLMTLSINQKLHHRRQRIWRCRLQYWCCLTCLRGEYTDVYSDVSATLADMFTYFRGYVPSDIIAGIALQAMHTKPKEHYEDSYTRRSLNFNSPATQKHFERVVQYAKFAASIYGCRAYICSRGVFCSAPACLSAGLCCSCSKRLKTIQLITGIDEEDVIFSSFSTQVLSPTFFVAYDHQMKSVVIVVRGPSNLHGIFTAFTYQPQLLQTDKEGDIYGHKGMLSAANALLLKLQGGKLLQKAFECYPSYRLVITGHSLGAGVASLLAIILKPDYPNLHCFAYAPPGCVINMGAVSYTRTFVTSIVFENDIISRLSAENFEHYSLKILHCIQTTHLPKYRIMLDSFLYWIGCCRPCLSRINRMKSITDLALDHDPTFVNADYDETDIYEVVADAKELLMNDTITGKIRVPPRDKVSLFIPGRIIHISSSKPETRCCGLFKVKSLQAHWIIQSELAELIVENGILHSHLPFVILKQLIDFQEQRKKFKS